MNAIRKRGLVRSLLYRNNTINQKKDKFEEKYTPFKITSKSPERRSPDFMLETNKLERKCKSPILLVSRAARRIAQSRRGMPQFFSPKRNFTESKYNKMQTLINKFFKLDKTSNMFLKDFTFRPKTNNCTNPRIKVIKTKTKFFKNSQEATLKNSSSPKNCSALSQGINEDIKELKENKYEKFKLDRTNTFYLDKHKRLSSMAQNWETSLRKQSMLTIASPSFKNHMNKNRLLRIFNPFCIIQRSKVDLCNKSSYQLHSIVDDESENSCTSSSEEISKSNYSNLKTSEKLNKNKVEKSIKFEATIKACPKPLKSFMKGLKSTKNNSEVCIQSTRTIDGEGNAHSKNESSGSIIISQL